MNVCNFCKSAANETNATYAENHKYYNIIPWLPTCLYLNQ